MGYTIKSVEDSGGDVLTVYAVDAEGEEITATGWVSATTNHYDPEAYYPEGSTEETSVEGIEEPVVRDLSGHLRPDAKPRQMTPEEVGAYALSLLPAEQPAAEQPGTPIKFKAPA